MTQRAEHELEDSRQWAIGWERHLRYVWRLAPPFESSVALERAVQLVLGPEGASEREIRAVTTLLASRVRDPYQKDAP